MHFVAYYRLIDVQYTPTTDVYAILVTICQRRIIRLGVKVSVMTAITLVARSTRSAVLWE